MTTNKNTIVYYHGYALNGNMISERNKNMDVWYNHLNLPDTVKFYDASPESKLTGS